MSRTLSFGSALFAVIIGLLSSLPFSSAVFAQQTLDQSQWQFKAVTFGADEQESTKMLNELAANDWEYVGPLGNSMVAFRRHKLEGIWIGVSEESRGSQTTYKKGEAAPKMVITNGNCVLTYKGETLMEATWRIVDPTSNPQKADLLQKDRHTRRAIYFADGDTLKICYGGLEGTEADRPKQYRTKKDDGRHLLVLMRVKK